MRISRTSASCSEIGERCWQRLRSLPTLSRPRLSPRPTSNRRRWTPLNAASSPLCSPISSARPRSRQSSIPKICAPAAIQSRTALTAAREFGHAYTLTLVLHLNCWLQQVIGGPMIVRELANSMLRLTTERGYSRFQDTAKFWHGWSLAAAGDVVSGSTQMRDAIAAHEAMGLINLTPLRLGLLAGIQTKAGNPADALSLLNEALATIGRTQERWFEAELHRLKADALLTSSSDHSEEAEASLRCAIGVAQEQD